MSQLISIIVPAYQSGSTIGQCIAALVAQQWPCFEIIVVDSSPDDRARAIVNSIAPAARYFHTHERMQSQAARNFGVSFAQGELLVFTDPDIYPPPGWLGELAAVYRSIQGVVFGPIYCHGERWVDRGVNLTKFHTSYPPQQRLVSIPLGWSGNVLVEASLFRSVGGFDATSAQGDSVFSQRLADAGVALWLAPEAFVYHDHQHISVHSFLNERWVRGQEYAGLIVTGKVNGRPWDHRKLVRRVLTMPLAPARLAASLTRMGADAEIGGFLKEFLYTLPIVAAGRAAWLAGLEWGYWQSLNPRC